MKYLHIFVANDATKAGTVNLDSLLEEYESVEAFVEECGAEAIMDYYEEDGWYLDNVSSVYVAETKTMCSPDDVPDDGTTYEEEWEIDFSAEEFEIPEEGVSFVQHNYGLMSIFCLEVEDDEEFRIESLQIIDGGNRIVYDGNEYDCVSQDGDDDGEVEIYVDGELLECGE